MKIFLARERENHENESEKFRRGRKKIVNRKENFVILVFHSQVQMLSEFSSFHVALPCRRKENSQSELKERVNKKNLK
mgnify:CR=1 FL=1